MSEQASSKPYTELILPPSVATRLDVARLLEQLEQIDSDMTTETVRAQASGEASQEIPVRSGTLVEFLRVNELSLTDSNGRSELIRELRGLKDHAPVVHMTFAAEADPDSLTQLVSWLRESIHPQAVIAVGLQPSLVAGVYIRTANMVHDLSLRKRLRASRVGLRKQLEALR